MNPHAIYRDLTREDKEAFAKKVGTTANYLDIKIFPPSGKPVSIPRADFLSRLLDGFNGEVSRSEMLDYFYPRFKRVS